MQRERSALDSFPEPIDLNQGSHPNNSMDRSSSWDNMLNPVENRLSNYMLGPTDGNVSCTNTANENCPSFSNWDRGESSTSANNNMQDEDDSKTNLGWSSFFNCSGSDATSEIWSFEQPSNISTSSGPPPSMQTYSSNRAALNLNSNNSLYKSGNSETEQIPTFYPSSSNVNSFLGSSSTSAENFNNNASGSSFSNLGSSCKRKALEGTSGQFYPPGGSSSSNQSMDKNVIHHPVPGCYASRGNLSISSSGPFGLSPTNYSEQINLSSRVGTRQQSPGFLHSSSNLAESSARNFNSRSNHGRNESVPFDIPRESSLWNFGVYGAHTSRPISNTDSSELRSPMNPNGTLNQSHLTHPYTWNGSFGSRGGGSSSSFMVSGGAREDVSVRTSRRNNNLEYPPNVSATPETRNHVPQDQIDWSFAPGNSLSSRIHSSGTHRVGPGSSSRTSSSAAWLPHQIPTSENQQRLSEVAPWIPFPHGEMESGTRRSYFGYLTPSSSSSDEAGPSSGRVQHQLDQRPAAVLMDVPGEDINGWRALAAVEGRHRLIRQMLTAMRRGVHLQAEEYMLVDPFMGGFAELHDRHRDMRLDVDNMSYEELLALEERIGNVSTGLSEERIRGSLIQRKYESINASPNLEPCCVCQEDYTTGDDIGILSCGHEFHTGCIKQWLTHKNLCPICKTTALEI